MLHILVVEDNLDLRELLCNALHESGYRAIGAENGEQALAVLSDTVIDLIYEKSAGIEYILPAAHRDRAGRL